MIRGSRLLTPSEPGNLLVPSRSPGSSRVGLTALAERLRRCGDRVARRPHGLCPPFAKRSRADSRPTAPHTTGRRGDGRAADGGTADRSDSRRPTASWRGAWAGWATLILVAGDHAGRVAGGGDHGGERAATEVDTARRRLPWRVKRARSSCTVLDDNGSRRCRMPNVRVRVRQVFMGADTLTKHKTDRGWPAKVRGAASDALLIRRPM